MLVLSRKPGQEIIINGNIKLSVIEVSGSQVRLGIDAPKDIPVHRQEVLEKLAKDEKQRKAS